MSNILIKAENISKQYRLGVLGSHTLKEDLKNWWTENQSEANPRNSESKLKRSYLGIKRYKF